MQASRSVGQGRFLLMYRHTIGGLGSKMPSKLPDGCRARTNGRNAVAGFTVIELMVSIAIVAILAGIAVPAFNGLIAQQRVKAAVVDLHTSLLQVRAEAVKRNQTLRIRPTTGGAWSQGWLVPDPETPSSDANPLFKTAIGSGVDISSAENYFEFRPSGRVRVASSSAAGPFILTVVSSVDSSITRCVEIGLDGRTQTLACAE